MSWHFFIVEHALWTVHFLLVFLFVAHIIQQRKSPASTLAWFLIVLMAPYIGLPLYLLLGIRKFQPSKAILFGRRAQLPPDTDAIQRTLVASGLPPASQNIECEFLDTGEKAFHEIIALIRSARKTIFLETFIFGNDRVGLQILQELSLRATEGLDVRILIDSIGGAISGHPSFKKFKACGGQLEFFMPLIHRPFRGTNNLRNHRKQIISDGWRAIIGGMNIASEYMGPEDNPARWSDLALLVEGPIVHNLENVFRSDWKYVTRVENGDASSETLTQASGNHLLQIVPSGPDVSTDPTYEILLTAIYAAKSRVWIATPYFVPDDALAKALELAARRSVDVCLLVPKKSNSLLADLSRNTYLGQIQANGARIFFYPRMMHAKVVLVDANCGLVGSTNIDGRSLFLNYELGLCLYSPADLGKVETWFDDAFSKCSEGFPALNWRARLAGDLARLIAPLI